LFDGGLVGYVDGASVGVFVVIWLVSGVIGFAIGNSKGRGGAGLVLGLLLGFIGWIIVAVMRPSLEVEAKRMQQVAAIAQPPSGGVAAGLVPCPSCAELIQPAAKVCRFCGRDVA
jgi:hypothetical protein